MTKDEVEALRSAFEELSRTQERYYAVEGAINRTAPTPSVEIVHEGDRKRIAIPWGVVLKIVGDDLETAKQTVIARGGKL